MNVPGVSERRNLRFVDTTWSEAAAKALFSYLTVSLDATGVLRFENIAFGPYAWTVKSVRFATPEPKVFIGKDDNFEGSLEVEGWAIEDSPNLLATLTRSLSRLQNLEEVTVAIQEELWDDEYQEVIAEKVAKALTSTAPPKLRSLIIRCAHCVDFRQFLHNVTVGEAPATLWGQLCRLDVVINHDCDLYTCYDGLVGGSLALIRKAFGAKLRHIKLHSDLLRYSFAGTTTIETFPDLETLDLQQLVIDAKELAQAFDPDVQPLSTLNISDVGISNGTLETLFRRLCGFKTLKTLNISRIFYTKDDYHGDLEYSMADAPCWNVMSSDIASDYHACRDLLFTVNSNRRKLGLQPSFTGAESTETVTTQTDWLMRLVSSKQFVASHKQRRWETKDWNEFGAILRSRHPLGIEIDAEFGI